MSKLRMSEAEREAFLAEPHVGVLGVERADGPPLTVPIWYGYEPGGDVWMLTDEGSLKGRLLRAAGRASLCAQSEKAPAYAYVSVEGPVTVGAATREHARTLAYRYFGPDLGERYLAATEGAEPVLVTLRPERWFTTDY